jgi:hypothetical protein
MQMLLRGSTKQKAQSQSFWPLVMSSTLSMLMFVNSINFCHAIVKDYHSMMHVSEKIYLVMAESRATHDSNRLLPTT